jgi:regulatory protein
MDRRARSKEPPSQTPDAAALHDAALNYLARYAATEASLRRMLERRIDRWARLAQTTQTDRDAITAQTAAAKQAVRTVVARLAAAGAVNDAAFAESRARSLTRAGRSRQAISAHLAAKGVGAETQRRVLSEDTAEAEFAAALVLARRRRIGPFRTGEAPDAAGRRRELAIFARAGFPQSVAARALDTDASEAEALVNQLRR